MAGVRKATVLPVPVRACKENGYRQTIRRISDIKRSRRQPMEDTCQTRVEPRIFRSMPFYFYFYLDLWSSSATYFDEDILLSRVRLSSFFSRLVTADKTRQEFEDPGLNRGHVGEVERLLSQSPHDGVVDFALELAEGLLDGDGSFSVDKGIIVVLIETQRGGRERSDRGVKRRREGECGWKERRGGTRVSGNRKGRVSKTIDREGKPRAGLMCCLGRKQAEIYSG